MTGITEISSCFKDTIHFRHSYQTVGAKCSLSQATYDSSWLFNMQRGSRILTLYSPPPAPVLMVTAFIPHFSMYITHFLITSNSTHNSRMHFYEAGLWFGDECTPNSIQSTMSLRECLCGEITVFIGPLSIVRLHNITVLKFNELKWLSA